MDHVSLPISGQYTVRRWCR